MTADLDRIGAPNKTTPRAANAGATATKEFRSLSQFHLTLHDSFGRRRWVHEDRGHDTPCWIWQGALNCYGYGLVWHRDRTAAAYKVAFQERNGPVPDGMHLDHLCRVRACVNPNHLEIVTPAENVQRGKRAKLTPVLVSEIKSRGGIDRHVLAAEYGVSPRTVSDIRNGRTWKNIQPQGGSQRNG